MAPLKQPCGAPAIPDAIADVTISLLPAYKRRTSASMPVYQHGSISYIKINAPT